MKRIHFINEDERELTFFDERIEEAIITTGAKLFVFDPRQAYLGGANMNSANGIRPLFKRLGMIASRTGCVFVLSGIMAKKAARSIAGLEALTFKPQPDGASKLENAFGVFVIQG